MPYYLSIGMTYEQFWYGEPRMVIFFRRADKMRMERFNSEAWLQGRYNYVAVSMALHNGFSKSKRDYPKEPFNLFDKEEEEKRLEIKRAREEVHEQLKRMIAEQQRKKQNG